MTWTNISNEKGCSRVAKQYSNAFGCTLVFETEIENKPSCWASVVKTSVLLELLRYAFIVHWLVYNGHKMKKKKFNYSAYFISSDEFLSFCCFLS